ncbi:MAG: hypothetical protein AVDCRST_MAG57-167 [uncultured Blastococcus sp.]|uniref:Uncharacterized protein n=1 Tax=uncultured Blastococcus sp. TaxID=217144 RepID=A0A6J4H435_9ACTN|nr:MAG: hypothetical protein AVDCRST_MAG57-167 [uncultured Blastococcus sp.]
MRPDDLRDNGRGHDRRHRVGLDRPREQVVIRPERPFPERLKYVVQRRSFAGCDAGHNGLEWAASTG